MGKTFTTSITISGGNIIISGGGGGIPATEIKRASLAFRRLFGVAPDVAITGVWDRMGQRTLPGAKTDERPDRLDLTATGQFYKILHIANTQMGTFVDVLMERGLEPASVNPEAGRQVRVRLRLPE